MRYGKWETQRVLGKGGQGTAYVAIDTTKLDIEKLLERLRWLVGGLAASGTREENRFRALELLGTVETYLAREVKDCAVVKVLHESARRDGTCQ